MTAMLDLSTYSTRIGRGREETDEWFRPVLDRGRAAVFVDTAFLLALIWPKDQWRDFAEIQYREAIETNFYTTTLVFGELVRRLAKAKGVGDTQRSGWFDRCTQILIDPGTVALCSPPSELAKAAYRELRHSWPRLPGLDLCDAVTLKVLEYAQHRRIFSFDRDDLVPFGALVEPG